MNASNKKTKLGRITTSILAMIASERLKVGDRVSSERRLAQEHGVSLGTAQRALRELEHRGILGREHGRGTFVRGLGGSVDARYLRFRDDDDSELPVLWQLLKRSRVRAKGRLERFFGEDSVLVRIDRRVDVDGRFVLLNQFFLLERDFDAMSARLTDDTNLRELIAQRLELPTFRVDQSVGFESASSLVARIIECEPKQRCFVLELRGYTSGDRPIYFQRTYGGLFTGVSLVVGAHR